MIKQKNICTFIWFDQSMFAYEPINKNIIRMTMYATQLYAFVIK